MIAEAGSYATSGNHDAKDSCTLRYRPSEANCAKCIDPLYPTGLQIAEPRVIATDSRSTYRILMARSSAINGATTALISSSRTTLIDRHDVSTKSQALRGSWSVLNRSTDPTALRWLTIHASRYLLREARRSALEESKGPSASADLGR